jgi:hypothetical protein
MVICMNSNMNTNKKRLHIVISRELYEKAIMLAIKKYGRARALSQIITEALEHYVNIHAGGTQ